MEALALLTKTFKRGIHPLHGSHEGKGQTRDLATKEYVSDTVVISMSMNIGAPAKPCVKKGDHVDIGQVIGEAQGFMSVPVHASVSGEVVAVDQVPSLGAGNMQAVTIKNDFADTWVELHPLGSVEKVDPKLVIPAIQAAGITGMGGASFPTHVKLTFKPGATCDTIIVNGAECETHLTADYRLMLEHSTRIVDGLRAVMRALNVNKGVIGIEDNKPEAIEAMSIAVSDKPKISVRTMITKYPQGGERSLIQAVAGVDFPTSKLPADVGCVVQNVGTLYAIQRAVLYGEPLFSQCFTITGEAVTEPGNYMVRVGTSYAELLEAAGGVKEGLEIRKALSGGPMMGIAIGSLDIPIQKQNNGLTLLATDPVEEAETVMTSCLRCGRCTTVCPMGLTPQLMADAAIAGDLERYEKKLYGMDCIQCGSCSFACPAKRPLTPTFKQAKAEILEKRKREGGAQK